MKIKDVMSVREMQEAGLKPYRTAANPWNYLLLREDGKYGFSLNQRTPTAWLNPCKDHGCKDGWHTAECIQAYTLKRNTN